MKKQSQWFEVLHSLHLTGVFGKSTPPHILLYGPPGTGKSSWAFQAGLNPLRVVGTRELGASDYLYARAIRNGSTVTVDGPLLESFRSGRPLVWDELDKVSDDVFALLHNALDDRRCATIRTPEGETVSPGKGFFLVGTTNAEPSSLPAPLLDRFGVILRADRPAPWTLVDTEIDAAISAALIAQWANGPAAGSVTEFGRALSSRTARSISALLAAGVDLSDACGAVLGAGGSDVSAAISSQAALSEIR